MARMHRAPPPRRRKRHRDHNGDPDDVKVKPKPPPPHSTPASLTELSQTTAPANQQAGLNPQDYPDYAATFSTGPREAVQYHYSRQDLYNEQYAAEQLAAMQTASTAGAKSAAPGPGQIGVSQG